MCGISNREAILQVMKEFPKGKRVNLPYLVATVLTREKVAPKDFDKRWKELVSFCKKEAADPNGVICFMTDKYGGTVLR
jgi:hypothetical protein